MDKLDIINAKNKKVGEISLVEGFTKEPTNKAVVHLAIKRVLAGKHHGTVSTKTRADVLRTTKKVYRQKGTGGARHGSMKSSPFVGGGRVFGPKPRDFTQSMTKKSKKLALREALKGQIQDGLVTIIDSIPLKEIKTKLAADFFKGLGIEKALVIVDQASDVLQKSIRNLKGFKLLATKELNVYELVKSPRLLFTSEAFDSFQKRVASV